MAVTAERPSPTTVGVLRDVHAQIGGADSLPPYDGFYVTWTDLARPSYDCPDVPCVLEGDWRDEGRFDVNPVTWHELAWHGVRVRGPEPEDLDVWTDIRALREHTHDNLQSYWTARIAELRGSPEKAACLDVAAWFALGLPRLHHVLATDRLTSKDGAGRYAVQTFGERWRPVVTEALAFRSAGQSTGAYAGEPGRLAADVLELSQLVLEAALAFRT